MNYTVPIFPRMCALMEKRNNYLGAKTDCGKFCVPNINQVFDYMGRFLMGREHLEENDLNLA
jgi:hypothetical protein